MFSHALALAHASRGGKCNAVRKSGSKRQAEGPEEANTWSCTELFPPSLRAPGRRAHQQRFGFRFARYARTSLFADRAVKGFEARTETETVTSLAILRRSCEAPSRGNLPACSANGSSYLLEQTVLPSQPGKPLRAVWPRVLHSDRDQRRRRPGSSAPACVTGKRKHMPDTMLTADARLPDSARPGSDTKPLDSLQLMLVLAVAVELAGTLLAFGIVRILHLY